MEWAKLSKQVVPISSSQVRHDSLSCAGHGIKAVERIRTKVAPKISRDHATSLTLHFSLQSQP